MTFKPWALGEVVPALGTIVWVRELLDTLVCWYATRFLIFP
jgi:hypothetical protein